MEVERKPGIEEEIEMRPPVYTEPASTKQLLADIYETAGGEAYVLEIPVPGLRADEIVVEADPFSLTVLTEPAQAQPNSSRKYIQREQTLRPMSRIFEFPVEIDTDNVQATLENGILRIRVPKAGAGKRKLIRIAQAA
jgi:HSP20 family protein